MYAALKYLSAAFFSIINLMQVKNYRKLTGILFVITIVFTLINVMISYFNISELNTIARSVIQVNELKIAAKNLLIDLLNVETSQRGFLITSEKSFLQPYQQSKDRIGIGLRILKDLSGQDTVNKRASQNLEKLIETRIQIIISSIEKKSNFGTNITFEQITEGKKLMDEIRAQLNIINERSNLLIQQRTQESEKILNRIYQITLISGIFNFLLILFTFLFARKAANELENLTNELEIKVIRRTQKLAQANQELERSNRELQNFASVASHDLQEPLRKIQAFGDRLNTKSANQLGAEGQDYLQRILAATARMRILIDDLLDFSRVTTKAQPFEEVNLSEILQSVLSDLETRIEQTNGTVNYSTLPSIQADATQMRQVFQNIIANALKFRKKDVAPIVTISSKIHSASDQSELTKGINYPCVQIDIADNCIGFEQQYADRIFTIFQRLYARHEYEGTGIGLAVVRKIIERHNGIIFVKSAPDKGTTFHIFLPIEQKKPI